MTGLRLGLLPLTLIVTTSTALAAEATADASGNAEDAEQVVVTSTRDLAVSSSTGLPLTLKETPQSATVIQQELIQTLGLTNVNDLLDQVPGINVERNETDRTSYDSRGFDITNFQVDSIGLPIIQGLAFGGLDTVLWDRVEVVRGANGMMTGVGNPSATVNYVRKRPTADFRASVSALAGSWSQKRIEADVSGPLSTDSTVQGRLIYAHDDHQSYLDFYRVNRNVFAGLLAWDITSKLKATVGYSRQQNNADGVLWGALPLISSTGDQIQDYPISASTAADWTYWNVQDQTAFAELAYAFEGGWSAKGIVTYRKFDASAKLLYAFGHPDIETGLGVFGSSGEYPEAYRQYLFDFYASGPYQLFGREHDLAIGFSAGRSDGQQFEGYSTDPITYPSYHSWGQVGIPQPSYPALTLQARTRDQLFRTYAATHLNLTDSVKGVLGFSAAKLETSGYSYGVDQSRLNAKASPYAGLLYDLTDNVTLYGSYTGIFNPQSQVDSSGHKLAPAVGYNYEAGLKSEWFEKRLYAAIAGFRSKQNNLATVAGVFGPDSTVGQPGNSYYSGVDTTSTGFDIELAGRITQRWDINGGYSHFTLADNRGADPRPYIPHRTLKLSSTLLILPAYDLHVGATVRWQNSIYYIDNGITRLDGTHGVIRQPSYATVGLLANAQITDHLRAYLNVNNITARKYLASLEWGQAYYAAPRNFTLSVVYEL